MKIELPVIEIFGRGGALKSSWYGDCLPSRDFPMLIDLYLQGRFDLDAFVSETIGLDDVEAAFEKMHRGEVLRSRGGLLMSASARIATEERTVGRHQRTSSASTGRTSTSTTTSGSSGTTTRCSSSTPRTTPPRSSRRSAAGRSPRSCSPTGTTTTSPPRSRCARPPGPRSGSTRRTGCCGTWSIPDGRDPTGTSPGRRRSPSPARAGRPAHPGHSPGSTCLHAPDLSTVFTGDTLFCGGPGATGRSFSDQPTILDLDPDRAADAPGDTVVRTGHGDDTTIAAEVPNIA